MDDILIVEDDNDIANIQRDFLEAAAFNVTITNNGADGLKQAMEKSYALIILDIMLPGMNGFEVCREIRKTKNTPVIFVSAKQDDIDKIRGLGLGADDYMIKPFSPMELVARVKAHINRFIRLKEANYQREDTISFQNIVISRDSRIVTVDGNIVDLANKEYELFLFMVENPNKALRKEYILDHVWGVDAFVESSTVAVHINRLREKIEKVPSNPIIIETVWGIGYRLKY